MAPNMLNIIAMHVFFYLIRGVSSRLKHPTQVPVETVAFLDPDCVRVEMRVAAPQISDIDGLALINSRKGLLAASDFTAGVIWLLNVRTGEVSLLVEDTRLAPSTLFDPAHPTTVNDADPLASIGANGLKYNNSALHFTNFAKGLYGTIPIDPDTGIATGRVETTFDYGIHLDDIAISKTGNVYLTTYDAPALISYVGDRAHMRARMGPTW